jgi:hypothetical protein
MSHLNFNVALARVLIKKGTCFTSQATTMVRPSIPNLKRLYYFMDKNIGEKKGVCKYKNKVTWYCPTCDDTIVCFGAYFVKLHNNST